MRIALPDLLATKNGRLATFFLLYVTEGIPLGFTATAIATQMRRGGLGPAEIGAFVGSLYLPWAFKWAVGPFVDTFSSERFGRRRTWIFLMQVGMMATLLAAMSVDFVAQLSLFTAIIFLHNAFAATMDVAIDALAVSVLPEDERGSANGFMFAGASIGQTIGGSGVLFLIAVMPFTSTYLFVIATILAITLFVVLPLREKARTQIDEAPGAVRNVGRELVDFVVNAWRAFTGSRAALVGVLYAVLPAGAYALSLALQSNLAVELGLNDNEVAQLNLYTTLIFAPACILGGWVSDRFGRRSTLAIFVFLTVVPTLWLAWTMWQAGWIMPVDMKMANRPQPSTVLLVTFWVACIVYNVFQGLYYGIRSALFMDITTPAVAATQFTAYMALMNLCISYTATWQGYVVERIGYPQTLVLDSVVGLLGLALLPLMRPSKASGPAAQ
ncbi:MAG TPA: MFS transporter [Vicinamibacterales bacterium]|nr:MFS transporter [Vicinamibacterales bacterium]